MNVESDNCEFNIDFNKKINSPSIIPKNNVNNKKYNIPAMKIKKYKSAYIIFSTEKRKILRTKFPNLKNSEITKLIAKEWKSLDDFLKEEYYKKEKKEKEIFDQMKKENNAVYSYSKSNKIKKPVRFRTPYMFFMMSNK